MTEGELGSAPKYDGWQWFEQKLKHSLKNNFSPEDFNGTTDDAKRAVIKNLLNTFFGMKWSSFAFENFLAEAKKEYRELRTVGLRDAIEARKAADEAVKEELKNLGYSNTYSYSNPFISWRNF